MTDAGREDVAVAAASDTHQRKRRRKGTGSIVPLPDGRYRPSILTAGGDRVYFEPVNSEADAEQVLADAARRLLDQSLAPVGGVTLHGWHDDFFELRENEQHHRDVKNDKSRWKTHVKRAHFYAWPMAAVQRADIKQWMRALNKKRTRGRGGKGKKKPLSWQTKTHALNLLRAAFDLAIEEEKLEGPNPCRDLQFEKDADTEAEDDDFNFLTRAQIELVQQKVDPEYLWIILFAIATGLRQGELRALRDLDVHLDVDQPYVFVRYGKPPKKPTKTTQRRKMPLLPMAIRALREWYAFRTGWCRHNPHGLTFPTKFGCYRVGSKVLGQLGEKRECAWKLLLQRIGIPHVEWHALRHTCATALLAGYFGRKWSLEEVKMALGHEDIETTQRYAHFVQSMLDDAVAQTTGDVLVADPDQIADPPHTGQDAPARTRRETSGEPSDPQAQRPTNGDGEVPPPASSSAHLIVYEQCTEGEGETVVLASNHAKLLRYARSDSNGRHSASKAA